MIRGCDVCCWIRSFLFHLACFLSLSFKLNVKISILRLVRRLACAALCILRLIKKKSKGNVGGLTPQRDLKTSTTSTKTMNPVCFCKCFPHHRCTMFCFCCCCCCFFFFFVFCAVDIGCVDHLRRVDRQRYIVYLYYVTQKNRNFVSLSLSHSVCLPQAHYVALVSVIKLCKFVLASWLLYVSEWTFFSYFLWLVFRLFNRISSWFFVKELYYVIHCAFNEVLTIRNSMKSFANYSLFQSIFQTKINSNARSFKMYWIDSLHVVGVVVLVLVFFLMKFYHTCSNSCRLDSACVFRSLFLLSSFRWNEHFER